MYCHFWAAFYPGAAAVAAAPLLVPRTASALTTEENVIEVKNLSTFQRQDQRSDYIIKAQTALSEVNMSAGIIMQASWSPDQKGRGLQPRR